MSNHSKIYLLFIEEKRGSVDAEAMMKNAELRFLTDHCEKDRSLVVISQVYTLGDPLPVGFILLFAPVKLGQFVKVLKETGQMDAVKRILPFKVPMGTALAVINKIPFPAIIEYESFYDFNQNKDSCSLIINRDQRGQYEGEGKELIGQAYRIDGQDLVKIIEAHQETNRERA